jgi:hypothetical protein
MLGYLLHASRGPLYSPREPRSRWFFIWETISLPYLGVQLTMHITMVGESLIGHFPSWMGTEQGTRDLSHDSPEANPGRETQSRLAQDEPRTGDAVTTRSKPTARRSHDSPEANRLTQSRLARGQPLDAVTTRPRPTDRHSHDSLEANLDRRHNHSSPTANRPMQSRLARGQPPDAITTHLRPSLDEHHISDSPEGISGDAPKGD